MENTVDSPDAAETLRVHVKRFGSASTHRGTRYFEDERVKSLRKASDTVVLAEVAGGDRYRVQLVREGAGWSSACSCPIGLRCKHIYAAARAWIDELGGGQADVSAETVVQKEPTAIPSAVREQTLAAVETALGRALLAPEDAFLTKLCAVYHSFRQNGGIRAHDIEQLGFRTRESQLGYYNVAYQNWWSVPPADPIALWQYIAYDIEASGLRVPDFMRAVTDTRGVEENVRGKARRETVDRWVRRLEAISSNLTAATPVEPLAPANLQVRLRLGRDRWVFETRADSTATWKPASRAFLDSLAREIEQPARGDVDPALWSFLALCNQHYRQHYTLSLSPGLPASRALVHRLLCHRWAKHLVKSSNGGALRYVEEALVWKVEPLTEEKRDYTVTLSRANGESFPPSGVHLGGPPHLYLLDDEIFKGPPPLDGLSVSAAVLPAEVLEQPTTLALLRRMGCRFPSDFEARIRVVDMQLRISCRLEENGLGEEEMVVDFAAAPVGGRVTHRWIRSEWRTENDTRQPASTPDTSLDIVELPAQTLVQSIIERWKLTPRADESAWIRGITKNFADEFLAVHQSLPSGVEVIATGELASLLDAPTKARISVEVEETRAHRDWFDLALALKPEDSTLSQDELRLLLAARGKYVRLEGKGWRKLELEMDGELATRLGQVGFDEERLGDAAAAGEKQRFHALQLVESGVAELMTEARAVSLRSRVNELVSTTVLQPPADLKATLRPYQRDGFQFLTFLAANRLGGVLADDMGLGKTLQTLAWLLWLSANKKDGGVFNALVVCPKSVVANWETETQRFTPGLTTVRYTSGDTIERAFANIAGPCVLVANYAQLRINAHILGEHRWEAVILDEGQFIKNPNSKVAQVARELRAEHRLVLTGTPIENRLLDLWSLYAFALPGLLGTQASFKRNYKEDDPLSLTRLRKRVRHFLLRRTKQQVATDLPPRTEEDLLVDLEGIQEKLYTAELKRARAQLLGVKTDRDFDKARFNILASLLRLRQICCHPGLVDATYAKEESGKLEALMEHIAELREEGHQVLVFSQFVEMLKIIQSNLVSADIPHLLLTGQTENREELVARFQTDKNVTVFLLSLKAAGFGLNLTAAPYVILYDPWWNPAVEAQAIDRAHRIGQSNPVIAYRLIARGTVEEKIRSLQAEKGKLAGAVVQEESLGSMLDLETLKTVLS